MSGTTVVGLAGLRARPGGVALGERVRALDRAVRDARPAVCAERALLVTRSLRQADPSLPLVVRKAGALAHVLRHKQVRIHPDELLVGCYTAHRVGGSLYPELHGLAVLEDLFRFERRRVNPLTLTSADRLGLLREVVPYWLTRSLPARAMPPWRALRFVADQLTPSLHLVNETGGISHFVPDYRSLLARGTTGLRQEAAERASKVPPGSEAAAFLEAVDVVLRGLEAFATGYREEALRQAAAEPDPRRRAELEGIAVVCGRVPRHPARSFHEGLQSLLFAQIALSLESLDNGLSPGRIDRLLGPLYDADSAAGVLDAETAFELLGCFAVKLCEVVPVLSERITRFHGGLMSGQAVVVGGTDEDGADTTSELSELVLELADRLRTRQPNYHARLHPGTPPRFRRRVAEVLAGGAVSPALYNDEVIVPVLQAQGRSLRQARDYATVGCVEPVVPGRSFQSTDAALFNLPLCLELALHQGRRAGSWRRLGVATPPAASARSLEEVIGLLRAQLEHGVGRLLADLRAVEEAHPRLHPTPLASALLRGCVASARDATAGGAEINGSGIQGVGAVEVGDALAALEAVVFRERRATMAEVVAACRANFRGAEGLRARLQRAPRYGNDEPAADRLVGRVMELFASCLAGHTNTRGGPYVAGFYSMSAHVAFGAVVGALPSGRRRGEPFSSGVSPSRGSERRGPTASLLSAARLPLRLAPNGTNFNLQLGPGSAGADVVEGLVAGAFAAGCMQMQVNVLDPRVLLEARARPGAHPGLLVRVSGYSAYFDDLPPALQQEVIERTVFELAR